MTVQTIPVPMPTFNGQDGMPLSGGYVYFGEANLDPRGYPKAVYFDAALTIPATQPLRTTAGYLYRNGSPTNVWMADGYHSLLVLDSSGRQVFYAPSWIGVKDTTVQATAVDRFSGTGAQTAFTLSATPTSENSTDVFVAGVYVQKNAYSVAGNVLTFAVAPASGTNNVEVNIATTVDFSAVAVTAASAIGAAGNASTSAAAAAASQAAAAGSASASAGSASAAANSEAQAAAIVLGNFLQSGTSAQPRTFTSKARESVSVYDYGADGTTNNTALLSSRYASLAAAQVDYPFATALTQSIDWCAFKAAHDYIRGLGKRGEIIIPPGDFYLSETWHVTNALNIRGAGSGEFFDKASTRLRFASDCDGIRVHSVLAETPDPGKSATKTYISDLLVYCPTKNVTGSGINATATVYLERVDVYNFADNGIRIFGSSAGGTGSANLWSIRDCRARNNGGHGLFVSGPDTNAGVAVNMDCSNNAGWGFYDASLLGNTYVGCHCNGNGIGSYKTTGTVAQNVFLGCYVEGAGNFRTEFVQPTVVHGGVLNGENNLPFISITGDGTGAVAKAVTDASGVITSVHLQTRGTGYTTATAAVTQHGSGSGAVFGTPVISGGKITSIPITNGGTGYVGEKRFGVFKDNGAQGGVATNTMQFRLSPGSSRGGVVRMCSGTGDSLMSVLMDGDNINGLGLSWNESQGTVDYIFANSTRLLQFGTNLSTFTGGRSAAITNGSVLVFPAGFWNGAGANARFRTVSLSAPTSGEYARGDVIDALSPSAAGTPGWVCTTGGTAGSTAVFKTRAVVAA